MENIRITKKNFEINHGGMGKSMVLIVKILCNEPENSTYIYGEYPKSLIKMFEINHGGYGEKYGFNSENTFLMSLKIQHIYIWRISK